MNSPLAYIGGKSLLAKDIICQIPQHKTYIEVFGGAAWVFFRKEQTKYEIINDLDSDLFTFYKVVRFHPDTSCVHGRYLTKIKKQIQPA